MNEKVNTIYMANGYESVQELDIENLKFTKVKTYWGFRPFIVEKDGFYIDLNDNKQPVKAGDILLYKELDYGTKKALDLRDTGVDYQIVSLDNLKEVIHKLDVYEESAKEVNDLCVEPATEEL